MEKKRVVKGMVVIRRPFIKKACRFCSDDAERIDYRDLERIGRYVTDRGKILPSRLTGNCARHQRLLVRAVKRARFMSFIPYVSV